MLLHPFHQTIHCIDRRRPAGPLVYNWMRLILLICTSIIPTSALFAQSFVPDSATRNWARQMFHATLEETYLPEFQDSYGVVFRDLNNDGLADLYVVRFRNLNRLFLNQGENNFFLDYTIQSGLGGNLMAFGRQNLELGASAVDYDNDGQQDVLITGWGMTTKLFHQKSDLRFSPANRLGETFYPIDGNAGVWADVNLDGYLDLFITDEHHANHLFISLGNGSFAEQSVQYGFTDVSVSQGASFADVDQDGDADLYVCNWNAPDRFFRNEAGQRFTPVDLPLPHLRRAVNSNGVSFGDIDNDGDPDLLVTDRQGETRLYENLTAAGDSLWRFRDITDSSGLSNAHPSYGSVIADFNNDGYQDIFFTNIGPNQLFLNLDGSRFIKLFEETLPRHTRRKYYSTGAAVADYDNDGDLDLFVANKDTVSILYQNPLTGAASIRISLEGILSNRDGIGAVVRLYKVAADDSTFLFLGSREISGGSGYLSLSEPVAHFGVPGGGVYRAVVRFPSGKEVVLDDLAPGQFYSIAEVGGLRKLITRGWQHLLRLTGKRSFWINSGLFVIMLGMLSGYVILAVRRYRWQNHHTALFLISTFALLYLLFWLLSDSSTRFILLTQLGGLLVLMMLISGFMEKIRSLEVQRYGYRQLVRQFSDQLIFIKNNPELYQQMVETISRAMQLEFCCIFEVKNLEARRRTASGGVKTLPKKIRLTAEMRSYFLRRAICKTREIPSIEEPLFDAAAQLLIPVVGKGQLHALLLLGKKQDGKEIPGEDLELLQILARQAAIAIENNNYIEASKKLIKKLTEAETRERYVKELEEKNQVLETLNRELRETQAQLIQSEKMASLGQLVAGVAHELNNPISFVYANMKQLEHYTRAIKELLHLLSNAENNQLTTEELRAALQELDQKYDLHFIESDLSNLIEESLQGSQRVKDVVLNLRNFSRLDEAEFKDVDLHEGLEATLTLISNELKNRITVHKDYGQLPPIYCNPGNLNQVFMNLLINAAQAIEKKGNIWISTRVEDDQVVIIIKDDGKGIPQEVQDKIFDPFFTTKPVGKGTGLGLSICYNIIRKHRGTISVDSQPGRGSRFTVRLPIRTPRKTDQQQPQHKTGEQ